MLIVVRGETSASTSSSTHSDDDSVGGDGDEKIARGGDRRGLRVFGERRLMFNEVSPITVSATSHVTALVLRRAAYEHVCKSTVRHDGARRARHKQWWARPFGKPVTDVRMAVNRLRFDVVLAECPVLATLAPYERAALAKRATRRAYHHGVRIVREGEMSDRFYIVLRGSAIATKRGKDADSNGAVALVDRSRVIGPGGHFGQLALLTGEPRMATVVAEGTVMVLEIEKSVLVELRKTVPTLEDSVMKGLRRFDHSALFTTLSLA